MKNSKLLIEKHKDVFMKNILNLSKLSKSFSKLALSSTLAAVLATPMVAMAAKENYRVNLRVGMKGSAPISVGTVAKSGKKSYISQFSDDGLSETLIEVQPRKAQQNNKDGLLLNVQVTRRVRGQVKGVEKAQLFAPDNQETEWGMGNGKRSGNLSLAVMAHKLQ